MKPYEHGGNVAQAARELGLAPEAILDFSASINPLGIPAGVMNAIQAALPQIIHYPEPDGASLREALGRHHELSSEYFLPGSGSTELIYLLPRVLRPRRALLVAPCFSEYERSLQQAGCAIDFLPLSPEDDFALDPSRLLHRLETDTELVVIANPANPTGAAYPPAAIGEIAAGMREQGIVLVDEAFVDFCPGHSVLDRIAHAPNLYLLRSFTKFFAIPGLRAGYLAGPPRGIVRLAREREPWTLSTPALAAAQACLGESDFCRETLAAIPQWRDHLRQGLEKLGLRVFPSAANYLLARLPAGSQAPELTRTLRHSGILIRDCSNFPGLDRQFVRLAVRTPEEHGRFFEALRAELR